tara:strand:- start:5155 stop:5259 length:105 start_codon:yes stop_codon:yes gene_type:complete
MNLSLATRGKTLAPSAKVHRNAIGSRTATTLEAS